MSLIQFRSCCRDLFHDLAVYFYVFSDVFVGSYILELDIDPFFSVIITHCMLTYIRLSWCFRL